MKTPVIHGLCALALSIAVTAEPLRGQDAAAIPTAPGPQVETSFSFGVAAQLTATRVQTDRANFGSQGFDPSASVLGTVRQSVRPWLGYSANFGFTRTTEENHGLGVPYGDVGFKIRSNVYELSLAYLVQKRLSPKLTGFADLGAGVLTFLPVPNGETAQTLLGSEAANSRPAVLFRQLGVASVGVDYRMSSRLALRAEYRGLVFKYPDFGGTVGRSVTESSQPTLSVVYKFGGR